MAGVQLLAALALGALRFDAALAVECPPADFSSVSDLNLRAFISKPWYIQEQAETEYLEGSNRCVRAEYETLGAYSLKRFWGYDVQVRNFAARDAPPHEPFDSGDLLCAKVVDASPGQLAVAPCFVPSMLAGPYWVIAYNETAGYALVSGGPPTEPSGDACRTGTGINGSGLWIFTRAKQRDEQLVRRVRHVAEQKGFDLSVLNFVNQTGCSDGSDSDRRLRR